MTRVQPPTQLKLAYLIDQKIIDSKLDPAKVDLGKHANLIRALYSRLVEFDLDGSLRPSLASSFEVTGAEVKFKIPKLIKTRDGDFITSKDVAYSLIRLLVLKSNRHSSLALFLCGKEIQSINDTCDGIRFSDAEVTLKLKDAKYAKFLLPILASVDFSIIPFTSISWDKPDLSINDYQNTSGIYYLEKDYDSSSATALLKKNLTHPYAAPDVADTVLLVNTSFDNMKDYFIQNKVDAIPTIFPFSNELVDEVVKEDGFVHETLPVKIWFLNNLENAYSDFTKEEISFVSSLIKANVRLDGLSYKCVSTNALFPPSSEGNLSDADNELVNLLWSAAKPINIKKKFKLWVPIAKLPLFQKALEKYPFIEVYSDNALPLLKPVGEQPHAMIVAMDSTFFEDLSMLNYNFSIGTFGYSKKNAEVWLETYINTESKAERIKQLQALHLSILLNLKIVPLGFSPYVAVAKVGWKIEFSKYYAGSPLWRIKRQ